MPNSTFKRTFNRYNSTIPKQSTEMSGLLGVKLGGKKVVEVPNRGGYVYVRLRNTQNEVIQCFNEAVSLVYNLPVIVIRDGNKYKIRGRDTNRYNNWGTSAPFLTNHGNSHSFNPESGGGGDTVWVYGEQFIPFGVSPSGTDGGPNVILADTYPYLKADGTWITFGITGTENIVSHRPTDNQAIMGVVAGNINTGNLGFILNSGTFFNSNITGSYEVMPYLPNVNSPYMPISAIRLVSGTETILWENIYDVRQYYTIPSSGGSNSTGSTIMTLGTMEGALSVQDSPFILYNLYGENRTISKVALSVSEVPVGADIICDVKVNGSSIFSGGNNAKIVPTGSYGESTTIASPTWATNSKLTWGLTQVGSGTAGSNLTIHIVHTP